MTSVSRSCSILSTRITGSINRAAIVGRTLIGASVTERLFIEAEGPTWEIATYSKHDPSGRAVDQGREAIRQKSMDEIYDVSRIAADGRKLALAKVRELAKTKELGLLDEIGGLDASPSPAS